MYKLVIKPSWWYIVIPIFTLIISFYVLTGSNKTISFERERAVKPIGIRFHGDEEIHVKRKMTVYIMSSFTFIPSDSVVNIKDNEYQVTFTDGKVMTVNVSRNGNPSEVFEVVIPENNDFAYKEYAACLGYVLEPGDYQFSFGGNSSFRYETLVYDFNSYQAMRQTTGGIILSSI